jgi:NAD-dependent SIR2 family protein deacetylase
MQTRPLIRIPSLRAGPSGGVRTATVSQLHELLESRQRILVLTGAGMSTESGIPAYRDGDGQWLRRDPILYQQFIADPAMRRRYWARSYFGWQVMRRARPNAAHRALVTIEEAGRMSILVTQNVDDLHRRAGSRTLVELHGSLAKVHCLDCDHSMPRDTLQHQLAGLNPDWHPEVLGFNPDGDVELDAEAYPGFRVVECPSCGGRLKPDVVFFGESVPRSRTSTVEYALENSDAVLIVGSSLVVMSGYRIVRQAAKRGIPVVAINRGRTRADALLSCKHDGDCVAALETLAAGLGRK